MPLKFYKSCADSLLLFLYIYAIFAFFVVFLQFWLIFLSFFACECVCDCVCEWRTFTEPGEKPQNTFIKSAESFIMGNIFDIVSDG